MSEGGSTRTDGRVVFAACILIYTLSGAAAATDKATELFESLYGDAYKAAVVSPSPDDDVTLAAQLLDAAKVSAADHPDLVKLLCEKAVELGRKDPGGYGSAIAALNILIERFPADAYLHQPQVVELYQAWFIRSRGDEKQRVGRALLGQLVAQAESERRDKRFNDADKTYRRALAVASGVDSDSRKPLMDALQSLRAEKDLYDDIDKAKAVLQVNPDDAEAKKKLLYAYLLELDDPKEAVKYADADPKAKVMLSMMTGDTDVLSPLAWLDLADWQSALADQTSSADAKVRMLSRSHRSYQKFLAEHQEKDLARTKAELASQKIEGTLRAMGVEVSSPSAVASSAPRPSAPSNAPSHATATPNLTLAPRAPAIGGRTIDLLKAVDVSDAASGKWVRQGNTLASVGGQSFSRITLPVEPQGDYELTIEMERAEGNDAAAIIIPVAGRQLAISLGWKRNGENSLEHISAPKKTLFSQQRHLIKTGQRHTAVVRVMEREDQASVAVVLDGASIIEWQGNVGELHTHSQWSLPNRSAIGLGAQTSTWGFHKVELRMLSGNAKLVN